MTGTVAGQLGLWAESDDPSSAEARIARLFSRVTGGLLGLACGDALGAAVHELTPAVARQRYGTVTEMLGDGARAAGQWSRDTATALAAVERILECPEDPLRSAAPLGKQPTTDNGSLAGSLAVALAYSDPRTLLVHGARLSALTHWHPQPEVCAAVYGLWIRELLAGADRYAGWREAIRAARDYERGGALALDTPGPHPLPEDFWRRLENVTDLAYRDLQPSGHAGYCLECLEAAAWCAIFAADAEQAIVDAVNLAGAAATLGALAAGAAGVCWGVEALPPRWVETLADRARIRRLANEIAELRATRARRQESAASWSPTVSRRAAAPQAGSPSRAPSTGRHRRGSAPGRS